MKVTITTSAGNVYVFQEVNGFTHVTRDNLVDGIFIGPFKCGLGEKMEIKFRKGADLCLWRTGPVARIEIT